MSQSDIKFFGLLYYYVILELDPFDHLAYTHVILIMIANYNSGEDWGIFRARGG
jgi:hypothetical protein